MFQRMGYYLILVMISLSLGTRERNRTCPSAEVESPSVKQVLSTSSIRIRLYDSINLVRPYRLHPDSVWDVLGLHGKLIKSTFQRIQPHLQIQPESISIINLKPSLFLQIGVAPPYLGPMGLVSSRAFEGRVLG